MPRKLGILAGGGKLPGLLIDASRRTNRPCAVVAFQGHAEADKLDNIETVWCRLGNGAGIVRALRDLGVDDVILAGSIRRPGLLELWPDFWTLRLLWRTRALAKGDDGLLRVMIDAIDGQGFVVVGVADIAPDLLTPAGCLSKTTPTEDDHIDIQAAVAAATDLGRHDIGQAAVARRGGIIASEDRAGTDAMLSSVRPEPGGPSGVLAKCMKPQQDRRADLPAIGEHTIAAVMRAGLRGIVVDAGRSMILDRAATLEAADAVGVFIYGLEGKADGE